MRPWLLALLVLWAQVLLRADPTTAAWPALCVVARQRASTLGPLKILSVRGGVKKRTSEAVEVKTKRKVVTIGKRGFLSRVKLFFAAYWESLLNPAFESELNYEPSLKERAESRKRAGTKRFGSMSDLPDEPSTCGAN